MATHHECLLDCIDGADTPTELGRVVAKILRGECLCTASASVGQSYRVSIHIERQSIVKGALRSIAMKLGRTLCGIDYVADCFSAFSTLYSWMSVYNLARVFDLLGNPGDWEELYNSLDEAGRVMFMKWLKASVAIYFVKPRYVFERFLGVSNRDYYVEMLKLRNRCEKIAKCGDVSVCVFKGVEGRYTVFSSIEQYLDTWVYELYPRPSNGDVVVDGGAYTGDTAIWFIARGAGEVHAFEPNPCAYAILRRAVSENSLGERIQVYNVALGDTDESVGLVPDAAGSRIGGGDGIRVKMSTLDNILGSRVCIDYIKLDVEGFEENVLRGAQRILQRCRPLVAAAVYHTPRQAIEVYKVLRENGYRRFTFRMMMPKIYDVILVAYE